MRQLLEGIVTFLPKVDSKPEGELSGVVFKIKRNKYDKREIYIRLYEGTIKARQKLRAILKNNNYFFCIW